MKSNAFWLSAVLVIAGCGGGGGNTGKCVGSAAVCNPTVTPAAAATTTPGIVTPTAVSPAPTAAPILEGLFYGSAFGGRSTFALFTPAGQYYVIYSTAGQPDKIAGVVQGSALLSSGRITSSDLVDFNFELPAISPGTLAGNFSSKTSVDGTVTFSASSGTFNGVYSANYDLAPSIAVVSGTYSANLVSPGGYETTSLMIDTLGQFSGVSSGGCSYSGTVVPATRGNFYNVAITFAGGVCVYGTSSGAGVAVFDSSTRRLYAVGLQNDRNGGVLLVGTK